MISLSDLDSTSPFVAQLHNAGAGPVTIINTFVCAPGNRELVLAACGRRTPMS